MKKLGRRGFVKTMGSGALAASLPMSIRRALAIPANNQTRSIRDVEHIVILTQENRSFDHYFGTMRGVRGFGDPRAVILPSGKNVFHQPNGAGELLPFRPNVASLGATFVEDTSLGVADCDLSVYGPNGFFREFKGSVSALRNVQLVVEAHYDAANNGIALAIANPSSRTADVAILDQYTAASVKFAIMPGHSESKYFSLARFSGWYDSATTVASEASIKYHLAGHVETGKDSISDPALGGLQE